MRQFSVALLAVAGCLASCERPADRSGDRAYAARLMRGMLAYPQSSVVDASAGTGAAEVTLSAPAPVQEVASWYRRTLRLNGWELENDAVTRDGALAIFARRGARPLWITLRAGTAGTGTVYTLIAADTTALDSVPTQRSGSSMSSNRIQRR
jgi:hypothetical protein